MALFNAASAAGNIVGPLLFKAKDAPRYAPGALAVMIIFVALIVIICIQVVLLFLFNKQRERQRVAVGKPAKIHDTSMDSKFKAFGADEGDGHLGDDGIKDVTGELVFPGQVYELTIQMSRTTSLYTCIKVAPHRVFCNLT